MILTLSHTDDRNQLLLKCPPWRLIPNRTAEFRSRFPALCSHETGNGRRTGTETLRREVGGQGCPGAGPGGKHALGRSSSAHRDRQPCLSQAHFLGSALAEGMFCAGRCPQWDCPASALGFISHLLPSSDYASPPQTKRRRHAGTAGKPHCLVGGNHSRICTWGICGSVHG